MLLLPYYRRLPLSSAFSVVGASSVGAGDVDEDEGGVSGRPLEVGHFLGTLLGYFFVP